MIPLRDHNPTERRPYVMWAFLAINVAVFLLWQPLADAGEPSGTFICEQAGFTRSPGGACQQLTEGDLFAFCHGAIPYEITKLERLPTLAEACGEKSPLLSLLTSMFMHGGLLHIAGNMLYLWVFGNNVEDRLGHGAFAAFYVLAGAAAAYAQALTDTESFIPLIGASGAIAGILGAYLVMYPHARVVTLVPIFYFLQLMELPALVVLGFWFVLQAFQGVGSLGTEVGGGVAWFAHIGGFAFGALVALLFYRRRRPQPVGPFDV
jgi:membrane associated rhomboid family serine protease